MYMSDTLSRAVAFNTQLGARQAEHTVSSIVHELTILMSQTKD